MGKFKNMSEEEKKKLVKDSQPVRKDNKLVSWFSMPNVAYYSVQLSDKNPLSKVPNLVLLKEEKLSGNSLSIPAEVFEKLEASKNYFLLVEGYNKSDHKVGQYVMKINKGGSNEK